MIKKKLIDMAQFNSLESIVSFTYSHYLLNSTNHCEYHFFDSLSHLKEIEWKKSLQVISLLHQKSIYATYCFDILYHDETSYNRLYDFISSYQSLNQIYETTPFLSINWLIEEKNANLAFQNIEKFNFIENKIYLLCQSFQKPQLQYSFFKDFEYILSTNIIFHDTINLFKNCDFHSFNDFYKEFPEYKNYERKYATLLSPHGKYQLIETPFRYCLVALQYPSECFNCHFFTKCGKNGISDIKLFLKSQIS